MAQVGTAGPLSADLPRLTAGAAEDDTRRCDMMPNVAVCVYCSNKVNEMEKSVNVPHLPGGVAHLACAQKGNDPNRLSEGISSAR